ncbi:hypothetical protein Bbelb_048760 [Branchiostoma belcheri]|nr:hypothetical protein Bbelb_048760 [Branchiostoma belcheri]
MTAEAKEKIEPVTDTVMLRKGVQTWAASDPQASDSAMGSSRRSASPSSRRPETSSSLLKRKRTNAHNARALNNKKAVGTYPPKPLQEGHSGDWIVKAFQGEKAKIKFFDYRGGGQYTPTQKASELVDPKYIYLVDFPTRKLMGEKIQVDSMEGIIKQYKRTLHGQRRSITLSKVIAAQWRALSDTDKQPFYDRPRSSNGPTLSTQHTTGNTAAKRNKFKSGPVVMAPTVESFRARLEACPP